MPKQINLDSMSSLLNKFTGLGSNLDQSATSGYGATVELSREELNRLFRQSWACKRVCSYLPRMMAREWGKLVLTGEKGQGQLITQVERFTRPLQRLYREGQILANKDGGAVVVRLVKDGQPADEPVDLNSITDITYSRAYQRYEISPMPQALVSDPGDPEYYQITTEKEGLLKIHKDRIIRFRGEYATPDTLRTQGWDDSVLLPFVNPLMKYLSAHGNVAAATRNFEVMVHLIDNLFDKLNEPGGELEVYKRLTLNEQLTSVLHVLALDRSQEDIEIVSRQFNNLDSVLEQLRVEMIAASGLTRPQFMQEHPSGLSATGQSERLAQADQIRALQEEQWGDLIRKDVEYYLRMNGFASDDWNWEWNSTLQLTPDEEALQRKNYSEVDSVYLSHGVLSVTEVRESRFRQADFSEDVSLDDSSWTSPDEKEDKIRLKEEPSESDEIDPIDETDNK